MKMKRTITILAAGSLVALTALGLMAFQTLDAQAAPTAASPFAGYAHGGFGRGDGEYLAEALGVTVEELQAAHEQAYEAAINEALAADLITEAQAEAMLSRDGRARVSRHLGPWLAQNGIDLEGHLADALGISVDDLQAAKAEAADLQLDAAVDSGRITEEEADLMRARRALFSSENFQSSMQAAFEAAVNQAVESGLISQAQADQILENMPGFGGPGGFHKFGGRGGFGGSRGPFSPQTLPSTAPATST